MNALEVFEFNGSDVRTLTRDGEPWFVASDVARVLGYSNPSDAITKHVDAEDVTRATLAVREGSRVVSRQRAMVNESGLYALIFGSKLPAAREFKRWVTGTVLPSIRHTGGYVRDDATAEQLAALTEQIAYLQREAIPPMVSWRTAEEFRGGYLLSDVAKGMGIAVGILRAVMVADRYLIADDGGGRRKYKPTQEMRRRGYLTVDQAGTVHVTRAGAEFLRGVYA
ncbi:BRO-N domain-containing protein [Streptomyces sp. O3]